MAWTKSLPGCWEWESGYCESNNDPLRKLDIKKRFLVCAADYEILNG